MIRIVFFSIVFFSLLLLVSCDSQQDKIVGKKWHNGRNAYFELREDNTYYCRFKNDTTFEHHYEFIAENKIRISEKNNSEKYADYFFEVKDSVLVFVFVEDSLRKGNSLDSMFYHLNPKYMEWQSRELYYFGKIISEKDPRELPYIYYEF